MVVLSASQGKNCILGSFKLFLVGFEISSQHIAVAVRITVGNISIIAGCV
eukprot:c43070_g1_i1 orf=11-160(-)